MAPTRANSEKPPKKTKNKKTARASKVVTKLSSKTKSVDSSDRSVISKSPEITTETPKPKIQIKGFVSRDTDSLKKAAIAFGLRLRKIRVDNGMTQKEMAESLNLNAMTYSRYEKGDRIPDAVMCATIISLYNVDAMWLLFGDKFAPAPKQIENYMSIPVYELADAKHINLLTMGDPTDSVIVPKTMVHKDTVAVIYREANMAPFIVPGAVVGIDTKCEETPMGHVYAVWVPNRGSQLYKAYSKSLSEITLRSDNLSTPDITINITEFKQAVLGKVEWLFQAC